VVQPRRDKFWNLPTGATQIDGKLTLFFQPQRKSFGIYQQKQLKLSVFCSAARRKLWNLPAKPTQFNCILFCRAAKFFGICQQEQLKSTVFCSAAAKNLGIHERFKWI
jgi:hypothetical protein